MNSPPREEQANSGKLMKETVKDAKTPANGSLPLISKEPGWRLSSNSKLRLKLNSRVASDGHDTGELDLNGAVRSETSISSQGSLRQFYRASSGGIKHQPKVRFDPSPTLLKEALEVSVTLEKLNAATVDTAKKEPVPTRGDSKLTCPLDPVGGFIGTNLSHVKLVTYDDEDEEEASISSGTAEKSNSSGRTVRSNGGKSKSSKRRKAPPKSNPDKRGSPSL